MNSYELLSGAGTLYIAPIGEAFPDVDAVPAGNWEALGATKDGVTVTYDEDIAEITVDQETGVVKAIRTSESLKIEANLAQGTLENLGYVLGQTPSTTAPGAAQIGTVEIPSYKGAVVQEYAFLFRADSPYGAAYPAQYELPRGYFGGTVGLEYKKDDTVVVPCAFMALVDLTAATDADKFGKLIAQNAAATG